MIDVNVGVRNGVLGNELLQTLPNLGQAAPLGDVLSLELEELGRLFFEFSVFHDKLGVCSHFLRFFVLHVKFFKVLIARVLETHFVRHLAVHRNNLVV